MSVRVLTDGRTRLWLEPDDRGLAYGDGVFETLLVHKGEPVWWQEHWQRLLRGLAALRLPPPDETVVRRACSELHEVGSRRVFKIIVTRGSGGRGYAAPAKLVPTVVLSSHPAPSDAPSAVAIRWCQTPVAIQPALAGIKHLNRLEQVLARAEWDDAEVFDGLMCDTEDRVISATSANLFALIAGRWVTPGVARCGIAGVARAWVLANIPRAVEADLSASEVSRADAVFLCNSVRGILPVRRLGLREWPAHEATDRIRKLLSIAQPAFAFQE